METYMSSFDLNPDIDCRELEKLKSFLQKAKLSKYVDTFIQKGVYRVRDLQRYVKDQFLFEIGMSQPERERFWEHVNQTRPLLKKLFGKNAIEAVEESIYEDIYVTRSVNIDRGAQIIGHQDIEEKAELGRGVFGEVVSGLWKFKQNMAPKEVAIKNITNINEANRDTIQKEADVWNKLDHPNIIKLYGVTLTHPFKMIMELAPKGSLEKYLRAKVNQVSVERMWNYAIQIASGLSYLNGRRIVHRDLACRNVLLLDDQLVKISDFGMTRFLPEDMDLMQTMTPHKVAFGWAAKEVLDNGHYSSASDVWSFGVTVWEIFSHATKPWPNLSMQHVVFQLELGKRLEQPKLCWNSIYDLLTECWNVNLDERPKFSDIHSRLKNMGPELVLAKMDSPSNINEDNCVPYRKNDLILIIDKSLKDHWVGQNQTNLKSGYILSKDMEIDKKKIDKFKQKELEKFKKRKVEQLPPPIPSNYVDFNLLPEATTKEFLRTGNARESVTYQELDPIMPLTVIDQYESYETIVNHDVQRVDEYEDMNYEAVDQLKMDGVQLRKKTSVDRSGYLSVALGNRVKISQEVEDFDQSSTMAYTTMKPSGFPNDIYGNSPAHDLGITRDTTVPVAIHQSDDDSDVDDDPYEQVPVRTRLDEYSYDMPRNEECIYNEPINGDTALTPQQHIRRKESFNKGKKSLETYPKVPPKPKNLKPKPPPPKPLLKPQLSNLALNEKPIIISILKKEFPVISEDLMREILEKFHWNLTEARRDIKLKLFAEQMRLDYPHISSFECFSTLKMCDYDLERATIQVNKKYCVYDAY